MMPLFVSKRNLKIIWHAPVWLMLFALPFFLCSFLGLAKFCFTKQNAHYGWLLLYVATCLLLAGATYFNANWLMPKIARYKKYSVGYFVPLLVAFAILLIIPLLFIAFSKIEGLKTYSLSISFTLYILPYLLIFAASIAYQIAKGGMLLASLVKEGKSETKRLETELTFFRGQANSPLVYHGLKNIVQIAEKKPEQLQPSLVKLTTLADYILHQPSNGKVPLEQEVESLKNYVELMQQGLHNTITIDIPQDFSKGQYEIRPMQLIPFIENAFKDCKSVRQYKKIALALNPKKNLLTLMISNTLNGTAQTETGSPYEITPTGIKHKLMINCFRKLN